MSQQRIIYFVQRSFPRDARSMTTVTVTLCELCVVLHLPPGAAMSVTEATGQNSQEVCQNCGPMPA